MTGTVSEITDRPVSRIFQTAESSLRRRSIIGLAEATERVFLRIGERGGMCAHAFREAIWVTDIYSNRLKFGKEF